MSDRGKGIPIDTLPNRLSLMRILSVPIICILISLQDQRAFLFSFFLFSISGITDGLDGFLARRWKLKSRFGTLIDPIADKLLISGTLVTMSYYKMVPLWLTVAIVLREMMANGIRSIYASEGVTLESLRSGKLKTALEILGISLILLNRSFDEPIFPQGRYFEPGILVLSLALAFGLYSFGKYLIGLQRIKSA